MLEKQRRPSKAHARSFYEWCGGAVLAAGHTYSLLLADCDSLAAIEKGGSPDDGLIVAPETERSPSPSKNRQANSGKKRATLTDGGHGTA